MKEAKKFTRERWKPVPGYEGRYQVSDRGRVLSAPTGRRTYAKILKGRVTRHGMGYNVVTLCQAGNTKNWQVSHLVLMAFVGPRPAGMEACHGPKGSLDDTVGNLRWGTHKSNIADKVRDGTLVQGEKQWLAKINATDVSHIRQRLENGELGIDLAAEYGIHRTTVSDIKRRKSWSHV